MEASDTLSGFRISADAAANFRPLSAGGWGWVGQTELHTSWGHKATQAMLATATNESFAFASVFVFVSTWGPLLH